MIPDHGQVGQPGQRGLDSGARDAEDVGEVQVGGMARRHEGIKDGELESLLEVEDYPKGHTLEHQGDHSMEQYFILDGILKRVVSNAEGKEMILRFAAETDIDTSYAAWRLKTPIPYSIRTVTRVRAGSTR